MVTPVTPSSPSAPTFPSPIISWQTLAVLPDQDSFYDVTDSLEQLGMERIIEKHMKNLRTEPDLRNQFTIYEVTDPTTEEVIRRDVSSECACVLQNALKYEDGEVDESSFQLRKERRKMAASEQEGRKSRRLSSQMLPDVSPTATNTPSPPIMASTSSSSPTPEASRRAPSPLADDPFPSSPSSAGSPPASPPKRQVTPDGAATTEEPKPP